MTNQTPEQKETTYYRPRRGVSKAGWAMLGTLLGFTLPTLACIGIFFALTLGFGALGAQGGGLGGPTQILPTHVSGPLTGPAVAIIEITGQIVAGRGQGVGATAVAASGDIIDLITAADANPDVKVLLIRVDSPGGSPVASDEILNALNETGLPVVVLMGDQAASGGYYISMAADHIYANPNTLTGSIGVISTFPNVDGLLEMVGVEFNVITAGDTKDFGSLYRDMTEEEIAYWKSLLEEVHEGFIQVVMEGREMSEEDVRAVATGQVFTGKQAVELGLVDEIGYESDAIAKAALLGIVSGDPRVIRYDTPGSIFSLIGGNASNPATQIPTQMIERLLGPQMEFLWVR